jgi:2-dehydropantoate 2-reductase
VRFIIQGAGAVGSVIGGQLAKAGFEVLLTSTNTAHVEAINRHGLILKGVQGSHRLPVRAVTRPSEVNVRSEDVVIVAVKCFACEPAIRELRNATARDVPVFCAQNGVRNEEIAARAFRDVNGMLVEIGATRLVPGEVIHTVAGFLGVGTFPAGIGPAAERVIAALGKTGLTVYPTERIVPVKWNKLLDNLNNATAGLIGLSGREMRVDREVRLWMADVTEEGARVLTGAGIAHEPLPGMSTIEDRIQALRGDGVPSLTAPGDLFEHRSSLWQDLYHRRGIVEAEFLNGEIVRLGRNVGIPTPYNRLLLERANDLATNRQGPGQYTVQALREALRRPSDSGTPRRITQETP